MKRVLGEWKVEKHKFSFKEENLKSDGLISFFYDEDSQFPFSSAYCACIHYRHCERHRKEWTVLVIFHNFNFVLLRRWKNINYSLSCAFSLPSNVSLYSHYYAYFYFMSRIQAHFLQLEWSTETGRERLGIRMIYKILFSCFFQWQIFIFLFVVVDDIFVLRWNFEKLKGVYVYLFKS